MMRVELELSAPSADTDTLGIAARVSSALLSSLGSAGIVVHAFRVEVDD